MSFNQLRNAVIFMGCVIMLLGFLLYLSFKAQAILEVNLVNAAEEARIDRLLSTASVKQLSSRIEALKDWQNNNERTFQGYSSKLTAFQTEILKINDRLGI